MNIQLEKTDLFCGEANYAWVERGSINVDDTQGDSALVRQAKAWAGWTGLRCRTQNYGDMIRVDATPSGLLQVLFITFE